MRPVRKHRPRRAANVLTELDGPTAGLVRLAAAIAAAGEASMRERFVAAVAAGVPDVWVDELVIQSYLFSGFPRALNAPRAWRRIAPGASSSPDDPAGPAPGR